jgi:hypothetical protein
MISMTTLSIFRSSRWLGLALCFATLIAAPLASQEPVQQWDAGRTQMTRAQMEKLLADFEQNAESSAYSRDMRARAKREAAMIRSRLDSGDFQVGDRVALYVEGETGLSDTFAVTQDTALALPVIGSIPLRGVLRSELQPYLGEEIGKYIRQPVVRVQSLIRVSILGAVGKPGFYPLPATTLLDDAIMLAGGPRGDAKLTKVYVERDGDRIWEGEPLQDAMVQGRTLDQLNLQAGDRVYVPEGGGGNAFTRILQVAGMVSGALWAILRIARI